jgi:hypothetical protein
VNQDVVDEAAVLVKQSGILRLAGLKFRGMVGGHEINQAQSFRPADFDLAHVADVEKPHRAPHGVMLIQDA